MKLSDTQRLILGEAAQRPDGIAAPPVGLPPAPRIAVARALLKAGLLAPTEADETRHAGLAWKLDGGPVFLRITEAGNQAAGLRHAGTAETGTAGPCAAGGQRGHGI